MPALFVKSISNLSQMPPSAIPQIALVGRSNVGKSSLVNRLIGQKGLARVSASPGHTETINFYEVDRRYFLVDLPGYGFVKSAKAKQDVFSSLINDYLENAKHLALVLLVIDARLGPTESDQQMYTALLTARIPTMMILNKMDKLSKTQSTALVRTLSAAYPEMKLIPHSVENSKDRGEILDMIERAVRAAR